MANKKPILDDFDKKMEEIRKRHITRSPLQGLGESIKRRLSGSKTPKA